MRQRMHTPLSLSTVALAVAACGTADHGARSATDSSSRVAEATTTAASSSPVASSGNTVAPNRALPLGAPVEPPLNERMQRALDTYAPGFQRFVAAQYVPDVDTTFRADGDFNGDMIPDLALYGHDKTRELLLVLLSQPDSSYRVIPLEDRQLLPVENGLGVSINTQPPGPLDVPDEFLRNTDPRPPKRLKYAAINIFYGREASELYYWNGKEFVKVATGD
jgi:hypothetical protein